MLVEQDPQDPSLVVKILDFVAKISFHMSIMQLMQFACYTWIEFYVSTEWGEGTVVGKVIIQAATMGLFLFVNP